MLFFWPNKLFHYYSNNLSNWGKSKISSIKDCNWFLTWKSGTKSLNWPMNESVTTYTSCWIYRYIICFGATCRSRDDPGTKIGQTGFYSDSDERSWQQPSDKWCGKMTLSGMEGLYYFRHLRQRQNCNEDDQVVSASDQCYFLRHYFFPSS